MTLHDRIMDLPLVAPYAGRDYEAVEMRNHAATLAAEADDLMREMAEAICLYATAQTATQSRAASDELIRMHKKLHDQKEQTDDQ